jgi:hypothetical protein
MAQKSNLLMLRKKIKSLNLLKENPLEFLYGLNFLDFFKQLLSKRGIIIIENTLNFKTNEIYLTLDLFFQTAKLQKVRLKFKDKKYFLKNKTLSKKETLSLKASSINKSKVALFLIQQFKKFQNNLVILNIRILNFSVRKELLLFYYKKLKKFSGFFSRRLNFFVDFLKLTSLFTMSKITSKIYLKLLSQIFKVLPKGQHSRFLFFIKILFQTIIHKVPTFPFLENKNKIKGIKFVINGKLKGKTRASSASIKIGKIPTQTLEENIEFSRIHIYTVYGVFGFKLWMCR